MHIGYLIDIVVVVVVVVIVAVLNLSLLMQWNISFVVLEFIAHQRTQQENRKKPSAGSDSDTNTELDEVFDEIAEEEPATTKPTGTKGSAKSGANAKSSPSKGKSKDREGMTRTFLSHWNNLERSLLGEKPTKNVTSNYLYNIDLETQDRISKLQKLKEYLEKTKGPEAWYHLFQTLIQHQQQDHSNLEVDQTGSSSSIDDDNFQDHLLALEQQWIADRQKTTTTTTTKTTPKTVKPISRKTTTTPSTTTKRPKTNQGNDSRGRRPPSAIDDEIPDDEEEDGGNDEDGDRYYWQPTYDDHRGNQYNYRQKTKSTTTTTTRRPRPKYPPVNREGTMTTLIRGIFDVVIDFFFSYQSDCAWLWILSMLFPLTK